MGGCREAIVGCGGDELPKTQITGPRKMCHCSIRQERDSSKGIFRTENAPLWFQWRYQSL